MGTLGGLALSPSLAARESGGNVIKDEENPKM